MRAQPLVRSSSVSRPGRGGVALSVGLALLVTASEAAADPVVVPPGKVVLPISGLEVELPKDPRKGFTWSLTGSYALSEGGASYDGRDVIDAKVDGVLVAGTWVHVGYFSAGNCAKVVAETTLTDAWMVEAKAFGLTFAARGGVFDFEGELGKVPALLLCTEQPNRKQLLVHHFFIAEKEAGLDQVKAVAALRKSPLLERVAKAWQAQKWGAVATRQRPEVRRRGDIEPVRTLKLARSGLELALPDDGFVWIAPTPTQDDGVDWLERMAPALPEYELEVARVPDATCQEVFDAVTMPKKPNTPVKGLPPAWTAGPGLVVDERLERTACLEAGGAAVVVGVFRVPDIGTGAEDVTPLRPLFDAIEAAARKP